MSGPLIWEPGETFSERLHRVVFAGAAGYARCRDELAAAGIDREVLTDIFADYVAGRPPAGAEWADDEYRAEVADVLGFPNPTLDTPEEIAELAERWGAAQGLRLDAVWADGRDGPEWWVRAVTIGVADRPEWEAAQLVVRVPGDSESPSLQSWGDLVGWPLRLATHLVTVVPWLRALHEDGR